MNNTQTPKQNGSRMNNEDEISYRLISKSFFCHTCQKNFKKMVSANQMEDVQCPECNEFFCEEVSSQRSNNSSPRDQRSSPAADSSRLAQQANQEAEPQNYVVRIVRRTVTDIFGNNTITEERFRGNSTQPFQTMNFMIQSPIQIIQMHNRPDIAL